jgi:RNA polymerase sigma-70 factor, ECF subfamily
VHSLRYDESGSSGATSASLLQRLKTRETVAWERFVDLYGPLIFYWGRRHALNDDDAADVMQEVLAAVARTIDRFQHAPERGRFRGWLWTITRNKLRDHRRRLERQVNLAESGELACALESLPEEWSDDASEQSRQEVGSLIRRALELIRSEFQPQTWNAFWRSVMDGQPSSQIAEELGLSENSVRQAKSRVLRRLRAELGDLEL